jgi:uncharacterized delta-60 repeat protein
VVVSRGLFATWVAIWSALMVWAGAAGAAPADLDRSFGNGGSAPVEGPFGTTLPRNASARMAIGPNDEIFVLYSNYASCPPPFACPVDLSVLRYDRDGRRDPSFGVGPGSQLTVEENPEFRSSFDLAVGPDGKPVVAAGDGGRIIVARFDQSGHLDGTFGSGGIASAIDLTPFEPPTVAVQGDGKVVFAVEGTREDPGERLEVGRYLANGEPDSGFGTSGTAVVTLSTRTRPAGVMLGPNGTITVAMPQSGGGSPQFGNGLSLARLLANGSPDPGFGGGRLLFPTPGMEATVQAAALGPDGSTFVVFEEGTEFRATSDNVVKLTPGGALDPTFGGDGRIRLFDRGIDAAGSDDVVVDAKGRLVGTGWSGTAVAYRLRADGGTDRTFNGGQSLPFPAGSPRQRALAIGLQSDGGIVALGESGLAMKSFGVIRLKGGTDRSRCLGHKATIVGTQRRDELTGTPRRDVIAALGGNDEVRGLSGADLICGGKGHDRLLGGPGHDLTDEDRPPAGRGGSGSKPVR